MCQQAEWKNPMIQVILKLQERPYEIQNHQILGVSTLQMIYNYTEI